MHVRIDNKILVVQWNESSFEATCRKRDG